MKKIIVILACVFSFQISFGQDKSKHDPTYSVDNYKHPNKAAHALKDKSKKRNQLETVAISVAENYKQPATKKVQNVAAIEARKEIKKDISSKHPMGL
jgi:hypothetical protein